MAFADDKASMQALINSTVSQANTFLTSLLNATNVQFSNGFNIDSILPASYDYATVQQTSGQVFGASIVPKVGVVTSPPPAAPTVALTSVVSVDVPTFLSSDLIAPSVSFAYVDPLYTSILLNPLQAKLLDNLLNGGYGIDTTDETALYNRSRDRAVEAMGSAVADAGRAMAARGFPLPPGELSIHVDRAYQAMQNTVADTSRDITLNRSKLYVENRQFTIAQVRELEVVTIGLYNSVQDRAVNVAKLTVDLAIALYNTQLARFKLRLESAKISADVQVASIQAIVEQNKANLDGFRSQVVGYEAYVRTLIASGQLQVEYYKGTVDNARVINDALIARTNLQAKVLESTVQQNIEISRMTIENARAKLLAAVEAAKLYADSIKFGAQQFFGELTALASTVNTLSVSTVAS